MGLWSKAEPPPGQTGVQMAEMVRAEIFQWHQVNPMRTWVVTYVKTDGVPLTGQEEVRAHRFTVENLGNVALFIFHVITPFIEEWGSTRVKERSVNPLTIPFDRVHSISMKMEVDDGTSAAGEPR